MVDEDACCAVEHELHRRSCCAETRVIMGGLHRRTGSLSGNALKRAPLMDFAALQRCTYQSACSQIHTCASNLGIP